MLTMGLAMYFTFPNGILSNIMDSIESPKIQIEVLNSNVIVYRNTASKEETEVKWGYKCVT